MNTQFDFSDYFLGGIALLLLLSLLAAFVKDLVKWLFGKKKVKVREEYEVRIFVQRGNIFETVIYHRDAVAKVEMWGKKYVYIKLMNGDGVEYEGFNFIVNTYKIPNESPVLQPIR